MPLANPYVQRIPADIKPKTAGLKLDIPVGDTFTPYTITAAAQAIRLSLKTTDTRERKVRATRVTAYLETVWAALRRDHLVPLSHRNAVALAKDLYAAWGEGRERTLAMDYDRQTNTWGPADPSLPLMGADAWESTLAMVDKLTESPEALDALVTARLLTKGIIGTDPETRTMIGRALLDAMRDGLALRKRQEEGDYTPDAKAQRFPEYEDPKGGALRPASGVSLTGLVDDWWTEAQRTGRSPATYDSYKTTFKHLSAYLKHNDAVRVRPSDIVGFKDHRLAQGLAASSVSLNLAAIKIIFGWAKDNLKVPSNPALGIKLAKTKATKLREKDFTPEEATMVLAHATTATGKNKLAKFWLPWLCAYTGARVGEMVQLRPQDLRKEGDSYVLTITPEAGTVKGKTAREVVLHEHLVARGFPEVVEKCSTHYVFLGSTNNVRQAIKTTKTMLVTFVREVIKDPNVSPNHGWRHSFKTVGRDAGISDSVLDAICGHTPSTEGGRYGSVSLSTQAKAMASFPRYAVAGSHQAPLNVAATT
jgi:integrase